MKSGLRAYGCAVLALATVLDAGAALAQSGDQVEEVVVTARKRAESLQTVPVAVTALSGEQLRMQNTVDIRGLASSTPGLVIEQNPRSGMAASISLRGQSTSDAVITKDQSVGVYIDDVYLARNQGTILNLFDIKQVQVLRGVQGTLFGRNNTGGAIMIATNEPTDEFELTARAALGNYQMKRQQVIGNVPVIDGKLAVRAGFENVSREGTLYDKVNGIRQNSRDSIAWRAQVKFTPTDNIESIFRYSGADADQKPNTGIPNRPGFGFQPPGGFYESVGGASTQDDMIQKDFSLNTTIDLGEVKVKNILAYHKQNIFTFSESDGYPTPLLDVNLFEDQRQYTGELQLSGQLFSEALQWLIGTYYFEEEGQSSNRIDALLRADQAFVQNDAIAGFGHLDYTLTDKITIGGGVRYTIEHREINSSAVFAGGCTIDPSVQINGLCLAQGTQKFDYWSWEGNMNYQPTEDMFVYLRIGKGQKAGGFNNITNSALLNPFNPEEAQDYEIGFKSDWWDRRARTNLAAYYVDYKDIQRTRVVPGPGGSPVTRVDNAASARIWGIEAELTVIPVDNLTLNGSFAYTDAKYTDFILSGVDVSGNEFAGVPKYTYNINATYELPVEAIGTLTLHAGWTYKDRIEFQAINVPGLSQGGYGLLDARAALAFDGYPGIELAVFGTNLTSKKYNIASVSLPFGYDVLYRGEPLMWGTELTVRFGG